MTLLKRLILIPALCFAGATAGAAETDPPVFQFKPQVPLGYVEQSTARRSVIAAGVDPAEDEVVIRTRFTISSAGDGFKVAADPISFTLKRAGKEETDPVMQIVYTTPVTYVLDAAGKLEKIEGYGKVLENARRVAPKEMEKSLPSLMGEKMLVDKETLVWRGRVGDALGKPVQANTGWVTEAMSPLPDGKQARYYIVTVVTGTREQDGRKLAVLKFLYSYEWEKLQTQANDLARDVVRLAGRPRPVTPLPGFSVSGSGERLIDPDTLIVYSEQYSRTIQITMMGPKNEQMPVLVQESRESHLVSPPAAPK